MNSINVVVLEEGESTSHLVDGRQTWAQDVFTTLCGQTVNAKGLQIHADESILCISCIRKENAG